MPHQNRQRRKNRFVEVHRRRDIHPPACQRVAHPHLGPDHDAGQAHQRRTPHQRPVLRLLRIIEAAEFRLLAAHAKVVHHRVQRVERILRPGRQVANQLPSFPRLRKIDNVVNPRADQNHSGHAMNQPAPMLTHPQHVRKPCVRELQRKARNHQDDEAAQQNQMLPALVRRHPHHERIHHPPSRHRLVPPDDEVVQEHRPNHNQNQRNVNQPHPLHCQRPDIVRLHAILAVHPCLRKFLRHAFVALSAGRIQIRLVDRRVRIARRKNIVHPVAARAVRRNHRSAFSCQPVIAVKVTRNLVPRNPELLRQTHALMATRADVFRKVLLGCR